ncbi:MAG: flagellar basal body rod C-terminal domain-containing protein, partial [Candidatus Puniceispirillaceae bacterium]
SETLQTIQVPPFRDLILAEDGKLLIEPVNGEPGVRQLIGSLGLVSAENIQLRKDLDGEIRPADGAPIVTDQNVNVKQGYIEESNVSVINELVASMGYQRSYEMNMKLIKMASELDQQTSSLLRMPQS